LSYYICLTLILWPLFIIGFNILLGIYSNWHRSEGHEGTYEIYLSLEILVMSIVYSLILVVMALAYIQRKQSRGINTECAHCCAV